MSDWKTFQDDLDSKLAKGRIRAQYKDPVNVKYNDDPEAHYIAMKEYIESFTEEYREEF